MKLAAGRLLSKHILIVKFNLVDCFVQDAASKGVGLVYDSSSEEQKKELVQILLTTLGGKSTVVAKVNEDTKVFEEGQLGKTPTGENLSTYKELW